MTHTIRWAFWTAAVVLSQTVAVRAQVVIDTRGLGWNGWGSGSGSQFTGPAEGAAQARALDAQTAMSLNEYIFQSQMAANKRHAERLARRVKRTNETADALMTRLRTNPTTSDVTRGDALNVAFDDLTNPKLYYKTIQAAKATPFPGAKIKAIPFQYASAAITTSIDDLTQPGTTPTILKGAEFQADLGALKKLEGEFSASADELRTIKPAQVTEAKNLVKKMTRTLQANGSKLKKGSADYREAENYLKGLYTMVTMLETPSMANLLAGVEKQKATTVGDLLRFMHTANLRFGVATLDDQREIYAELFGILDGLRKDLVGEGMSLEPPKLADRSLKLGDLLKGMQNLDFSQLDKLRILPSPPEELKKLLPPRPRRGRPGDFPPPPPPPFGK